MMMFSVLGTSDTFCGQNLGAGKYEKRIEKGITILMGWCNCVMSSSYTVVPTFMRCLSVSDNRKVIDTATL